ncbi:MAG TPA: HD-GYP domain-containing protein, partial [Thermoanaerobaculia bacterium]|nr:HD-GYP domain-containing protein [Thermoanaerobaculia bacterium]
MNLKAKVFGLAAVVSVAACLGVALLGSAAWKTPEPAFLTSSLLGPIPLLAVLAVALLVAWIGADRICTPYQASVEARFLAAQHNLHRSYAEAIEAVVTAIDARDNDTTGHSFRVARYAVALGRQMSLSERDLETLEWGSLLHDIGKLAVPDAVLWKGGPLTEEEWLIMRQHPVWGAEILENVEFLSPALAVVAHHQERWDGTGYPSELAREQIPLLARIFAVVDTYDSLTSDRPYRRACPHSVAVAELSRVAGTQLDPQVVSAFLTLSETELRRLRDEVSLSPIDLSPLPEHEMDEEV